MIKVDEIEPRTAILEKFEKNKKIKNQRAILTSREKLNGLWKWNSNSDYTLAEGNDSVFKLYNSQENLNIEKAYKNGQTHVWLGSLSATECVNRYFIDFEKMQQINCADNLRRRRVKRVTV